LTALYLRERCFTFEAAKVWAEFRGTHETYLAIRLHKRQMSPSNLGTNKFTFRVDLVCKVYFPSANRFNFHLSTNESYWLEAQRMPNLSLRPVTIECILQNAFATREVRQLLLQIMYASGWNMAF
jgi:hypothetical protein